MFFGLLIGSREQTGTLRVVDPSPTVPLSGGNLQNNFKSLAARMAPSHYRAMR
jgi:hypothetical protein